MAASFKIISVNKSVLASTPVTQDITGCNFTPKGYIMYTSAVSTVGDHIRSSMGFCDGTNQRCVGWSVTDNSGSGGSPSTTQSARIDRNDRILYQITGSGAVEISAEHVQMLSDTGGGTGGVRIRFLDNNVFSYPLTFIFFGGDDIVNVKVGTFNTPTTTGQLNVTGLGFNNVNALFLMGTNAALPGSVNIGATRAKINFGFACSPSKQFGISTVSRDAVSTSSTFKQQSLSSVYLSLASNTATVIERANYTGPITNGFGLNFTTVDTDSWPVFYLAIRGGSWDLTSVNSRTTTGTQTVTNPTNFTPKLGILSTIVSADETSKSNNTFAIGAASATSEQSSIWCEDLNAVAPSRSARSSTTGSMLQTRATDAFGNNSAIVHDVDLSSFNAGNLVLSYAATSATATKIHVISVGDNPPGGLISTVEKDWSFPYHIRILQQKDWAFPYHMGGPISAGPYEHRYSILGTVTKDWEFPYHLTSNVQKDWAFVYNVLDPANAEVIKDWSFPYHIIHLVSKDYEFPYHLDESPDLNLSGYLKPYKCRVFIMSFDGTETYHVFNQFDFEASNIGINGLRFDLGRDTAGDFEITVEDSNLMIDTSLVGEGCSVLIQVAKRESELGDGNHNVLWGYMKVKEVQRPETNNLVYKFTGYGAAVRTMERIIDFRDEARRMSHSSTEADPTDTKMQAWRLFHRLFSDRSVFPAGLPREKQFDTSEIEAHEPKVDVFIPLIDQYLVEMSQAANFIADNSNAVWGVNPKKQPYIKYKVTEKTNVVLKGKFDPSDDRFKTAYIKGGFRFHDSIEKSDGFFNCLFAVVGTKEITSNVINLSAIKDRYSSLALDEPPSDAVDEDVVSDIGPMIPLYNADPQAGVWDELVNLAKQWPINRFRVVIKPYSGSDGFGSLPDTAKSNWNTTIDKMQDSVNDGIYVFGWVDSQNGNKSLSQVKSEITQYAEQSQVDGILLDNMSTSTSDISYYDSIADHAKSYKRNQGNSSQTLSIYANAAQTVPQSFYTQTSIDRFIIYNSGGLPDVSNLMQSWYSEIGPSRRIVWAHSITTSNYTDTEVKNFVQEATDLTDLCNIVYLTHVTSSPHFGQLSTRINAMMTQLDASAARSLQNSGRAPPGRAVQQDLAMSFVAQSSRTSDLIIILSKVGNPVSEPGENLNQINGLIMGNRVVKVTEVDPETNQTVVRDVDMPDYTKTSQIAFFNIPFNEVGVDTPTIHFLHKTVVKNNVRIGQRYWVFLRGRGQNSSNTFRWHHADTVGYDYKAARRLPSAGAYSSAQWDVFSNETHPGFALSYLQNTTQLSIAMNGDSAKIHGQVDEIVDLSEVTDDQLVSKIQQSMLADASLPKRVYEFEQVTVPDEPILPGQLITIIDDLSEGGQAAGGTAGGIQAEVVEVSYNFSPEEDGCAYLRLRAIANVNREYAYWKGKLDRKELDVDFPFIPPPGPRPPPDTQAPVVQAQPKGGTYASSVSVKFVVSEKSATVFYTTDGTTPVVTFGGLEEETAAAQTTTHTTQQYIPNESPNIIISKPTELQFIAVDAAGNKSTVYLEKYNITNPVNIGKAIFGVFFQDTGLSASAIAAGFNQYLREDTDMVTLHKRIEESINSTWENAVLGVPAKFHEVEFQGYDQMASYLPTAKSKGFDIIGYNIERDDSPSNDTRDVVSSVKRFSDKVHKEGLLVRLNPRHDYTKTYGARIAKYADIYNIQAHHRQGDIGRGDVDDFKRIVKESAQTLRANNSKIFLTVTMSADLKQHDSGKNMNRLETLKARWVWAKRYVDGVRIFYKTSSEFNNIVLPFLSWMNTDGRS